MARRKNKLVDRLARLEESSRVGMWQLILADGSTAALPVVTVIDALADLFDRAGQPEVDHGPLSREIGLLARVAEDSETSMLGRTVVVLARKAVLEAQGGEGAR